METEMDEKAEFIIEENTSLVEEEALCNAIHVSDNMIGVYFILNKCKIFSSEIWNLFVGKLYLFYTLQHISKTLTFFIDF